ncbi:BACON domain-containing protein [Alistipes onderdonkii]|uniref:BACON domain-containing protein n=1 Tax=Alistipes onderdonkii TaxID=328813 RepID=UPI00374C9927
MAQSDKPEWCKILTSSGDKGSDRQLNITVEANETGSTRSANITVQVSGYARAAQFAITQLGSSSGGTGADTELNKQVDKILEYYYLWNGEYRQMSRDLSLDYISSSDNFLKRTLLEMTTNDLDKKRQLLGLLLPAADAPHKGRRRDEARGQPRGRKEEGVRLRHRGPDGREVCGRQQPTYGRVRAGRHVGLPGLPGIGSGVPAGDVFRPVQRRGHHGRKPEFGLRHVNSPGRRKHGQAHRKQAGSAARIAHGTRNIPQSGNPQRSNHLRCA